MTDALAFLVIVLGVPFVIWSRYRAAFPPDPPHWRSPGLSMEVRNGRIHYRKGRGK